MQTKLQANSNRIFNCLLLVLFNFLVKYDQDMVCAQKKYTSQENVALEKFRPLVSDKLTIEVLRKDGYLLRWLRAYDFDLQMAKKALEKSLKWRMENSIDTILDGIPVKPPSGLPYSVDGVDRQGNPLVIFSFGQWKLRRYIVAGKTREASKEFKIMMEKGIRKIFEQAELTGKDIESFYFLVDMMGYNRKENMCVACIPLTLDFALSVDSLVSVFLKNATLINVPRYFQPLFKLCKDVVGLHVLKKVQDFDYNRAVWEPVIHHDISPDQLPRSMGGNRVDK